MSGAFKVNFAGLQNAAQDIRSSGNQIRSRLEDLDRELAPLRADWTGAASEAYNQSKAQWTKAITEMNELLDRVGQAVDTSGQDYQSSDTRNSQRWG